MAHTPGPWEAEWHKSGDAVREDTGYFTIDAVIAHRNGTTINNHGTVADTLNRDYCIDPDEDRANASIIAAAPELLAACRAVIEATGGSKYWNGKTKRFLELCEGAVAKATNPRDNLVPRT